MERQLLLGNFDNHRSEFGAQILRIIASILLSKRKASPLTKNSSSGVMNLNLLLIKSKHSCLVIEVKQHDNEGKKDRLPLSHCAS